MLYADAIVMVEGSTIKARILEPTKEMRPSRRNRFNGIFREDKCFALGCTKTESSKITAIDSPTKTIVV